MNQQIRQFKWATGYAVVALLTLTVAVVSFLRFFTGTVPVPDFILENELGRPFLVVHAGGGIVALLLGPLQFVRSLRNRALAFHRVIGRAYIGACTIGALAGLPLALGVNTGPVAGAGFAISGVLWLFFTYQGLRTAIERRFREHREWMIRSYAMTFNGITLRLMIPLGMLLKFEFFTAYIAIAWLNWTVNLFFFEMYIRRTRPRARVNTKARLATA